MPPGERDADLPRWSPGVAVGPKGAEGLGEVSEEAIAWSTDDELVDTEDLLASGDEQNVAELEGGAGCMGGGLAEAATAVAEEASLDTVTGFAREVVVPARRAGGEARPGTGDGDPCATAVVEEEPFVEPICRADPSRFVLFPIKHPHLWDMYKRAKASFWTVEEVDLGQVRVGNLFVGPPREPRAQCACSLGRQTSG